MKRSFSKIRHIKESNLKLEKRFLKEEEKLDAKKLGAIVAQQTSEEDLMLISNAIKEMGIDDFKDYVEDIAKEKIMNESFLDTKAKTEDEAKKIEKEKLKFTLKSMIAKIMTLGGGLISTGYYMSEPNSSIIPVVVSATVFAGLLGLDYFAKKPVEVETSDYNFHNTRQEKFIFDILKNNYDFDNHIHDVLDGLKRDYKIPENVARKFVNEYERIMKKRFKRSGHDFIRLK